MCVFSTLQPPETRKTGFLALKSGFRFSYEMLAHTAEKPGFCPHERKILFRPISRFMNDHRISGVSEGGDAFGSEGRLIARKLAKER